VIGPALAYLFGGLAVLSVWTVWMRIGREISAGFVESLVESAKDAPGRWRWTRHPWSSSRLSDEDERRRAGFWMWLPLTLFAPLLALVLLASAFVEFAR
jgi:hypothetical protein